MSEKMMDEFEIVFPMPNHVMRCGKGYVATEYSDWRANDYCQKWIGWQASRAALVVDLPEKAALMSASSVYAALDDAGVVYK
jgi:hypothetical protein